MRSVLIICLGMDRTTEHEKSLKRVKNGMDFKTTKKQSENGLKIGQLKELKYGSCRSTGERSLLFLYYYTQFMHVHVITSFLALVLFFITQDLHVIQCTCTCSIEPFV